MSVILLFILSPRLRHRVTI